MPISVRLVLSTAVALSMVLMVTFSQVQLTWSPVSSWLRPPYLYLVMNCIIITIFASSKLHHYSEPVKIDNYCEGEDQSKLVDIMQPQTLEVFDEIYGNEDYSVPPTKPMVLVSNEQLDVSDNASVSYSDDGTTNSANSEPRKLPGSASVEANTEGRKDLGVPKPEQELETLESTWKAITDGRAIPNTHQHTGGNLQNSHKMIKSETFNQQQTSNWNNISRTLEGSSGPEKLKRDPSLGQDDLNKRAEAFISRFKEDMILQRKESLRQYAEMINSGAY